MTHHVVTEDELRQFEANVKKIKLSRDGVKEHTANGGRGGGAVTERRQAQTAFVGTAVKYGTRTSHATNPYRSKWEAAFANKLELEKHAGLIKQWWYEPFSLWLPGKVRYKPDFMIQYPDGMEQRLEIVEVKGWSRNRRDGITRLKIAAALFPCFVWRMVWMKKGGGFDGEYL